MDRLANTLLDRIGPRLTGSRGLETAERWIALQARGLPGLHVWREPFAFGRGWEQRHLRLSLDRPHSAALPCWQLAWTPGTEGPVAGPLTHLVLRSAEDIERVRAIPPGRFLLLETEGDFLPQILEDGGGLLEGLPARRLDALRRQRLTDHLRDALGQAAPLAVIGKGIGTGSDVRVEGEDHRLGRSFPVPRLVLPADRFTMLARLLADKVPVALTLDAAVSWNDRRGATAHNLLAEIEGEQEDIVLVGAHLDSWHAGTGATDNGAGAMILMEAMYRLSRLSMRPRRTIRAALWAGEEQIMLGSCAYVERHIGRYATAVDPVASAMAPLRRPGIGLVTVEPGHARHVAYINVDCGGDGVAGIASQGNADPVSVLRQWLPEMSEVNAQEDLGSDHISFRLAGIPALDLLGPAIMDTALPSAYHAATDLRDRLDMRDLASAAGTLAALLWKAANAGQVLRRPAVAWGETS